MEGHHREPAVDDELRAVDVARLVRSERQASIGHIPRRAHLCYYLARMGTATAFGVCRPFDRLECKACFSWT